MLSDEERERLAAEIRAGVEALAGEAVLAFGFFGQAGLYADPGPRFAVREGYGGAPLIPVLRSLFGRARGRGLPLQVLLAATPTRILAVAYDTGMRGVSPTKVLQSWERSVTAVALEEGERGLPRIRLSGPGEQGPVRLDSADVQQTGVNDAVIELLCGRA